MKQAILTIVLLIGVRSIISTPAQPSSDKQVKQILAETGNAISWAGFCGFCLKALCESTIAFQLMMYEVRREPTLVEILTNIRPNINEQLISRLFDQSLGSTWKALGCLGGALACYVYIQKLNQPDEISTLKVDD